MFVKSVECWSSGVMAMIKPDKRVSDTTVNVVITIGAIVFLIMMYLTCWKGAYVA